VPEQKPQAIPEEKPSGKSIWEGICADLGVDWTTLTPADQEMVQQEFDRSGVTSPRRWLQSQQASISRQTQSPQVPIPSPVVTPPAPAKTFDVEFQELFGPTN
jgi:hypothetical protein